MQINAASLLAAQQARPQTAARPPINPADELFEPLFGKADIKAATPAQGSAPAVFARPGSRIDIRV